MQITHKNDRICGNIGKCRAVNIEPRIGNKQKIQPNADDCRNDKGRNALCRAPDCLNGKNNSAGKTEKEHGIAVKFYKIKTAEHDIIIGAAVQNLQQFFCVQRKITRRQKQ